MSTRHSLRQVVAAIVTLFTLLFSATAALAGPPSHAGGGKDGGDTSGDSDSGTSGGEKCHPKKGCPTNQSPTIEITSPADGASVSGMITVSGTAADDSAVASVEVQVDGGAWQPANGTESWSKGIDTTALSEGSHVLIARAIDGAGLTASSQASVLVDNSDGNDEGELSTSVLTNPQVGTNLVITGRGRMASDGSRHALVYQEAISRQPWLLVEDTVTGSASHVQLPTDISPGNDWHNAHYTLRGDDLLVFSGGGPVHARHYSLSGGSLPTSATLVSSRSFGDTDSRAGGWIGLASGGYVGVWHQQASTGTHGHRFAYRSPLGAWSTLEVSFMPTTAAIDALVQHPADGTIWLFSDPDSWGAIGAAHLVETASGLSIDWTDGSFIDSSSDGNNGPDPENPDLVAAADPSTGTIALAYQNRDRVIYSYSPWRVGSRVSVARIGIDGSRSFTVLPTRVERVSDIGLVVRPGETWLAYRPMADDLTFDDIEISVHRDGAWEAPTSLGTLADPYGTITYGDGIPSFGGRMTDNEVHRLS